MARMRRSLSRVCSTLGERPRDKQSSHASSSLHRHLHRCPRPSAFAQHRVQHFPSAAQFPSNFRPVAQLCFLKRAAIRNFSGTAMRRCGWVVKRRARKRAEPKARREFRNGRAFPEGDDREFFACARGKMAAWPPMGTGHRHDGLAHGLGLAIVDADRGFVLLSAPDSRTLWQSLRNWPE